MAHFVRWKLPNFFYFYLLTFRYRPQSLAVARLLIYFITTSKPTLSAQSERLATINKPTVYISQSGKKERVSKPLTDLPTLSNSKSAVKAFVCLKDRLKIGILIIKPFSLRACHPCHLRLHAYQ